MKLKYKFTMTTVADDIVAIPLDSEDQFDGVLTINETMKDIMELLAEDRTEEELTAAMMERYDNVSKIEMEAAIHEICDGLKNEGLLE